MIVPIGNGGPDAHRSHDATNVVMIFFFLPHGTTSSTNEGSARALVSACCGRPETAILPQPGPFCFPPRDRGGND